MILRRKPPEYPQSSPGVPLEYPWYPCEYPRERLQPVPKSPSRTQYTLGTPEYPSTPQEPRENRRQYGIGAA